MVIAPPTSTVPASVFQCRSLPEASAINGNSQIFFFQAEDGIRDVAVTGVQTCSSDSFRLIYQYSKVLGLLEGLRARLADSTSRGPVGEHREQVPQNSSHQPFSIHPSRRLGRRP